MSKRIKLSADGYQRGKANRKENVLKYAGCTVATVKKAEKRNSK